VTISLNSIHQLIYVKVKCFVFLDVRTELLNIISATFGAWRRQRPQTSRKTKIRSRVPEGGRHQDWL